MGDRLSALLAGLAVLVGVVVAGAGLSVFVEAWQVGRAWAGSGEAHRIEAHPAGDAPLWIDAPAGQMTDAGAPQHGDPGDGSPGSGDPAESGPAGDSLPPAPLASAGAGAVPAPASPVESQREAVGEARQDAVTPTGGLPEPSVRRARPDEVGLAGLDFRFLDPPEPGAHARLAVSVRNRADAPTDPLVVALPATWFAGFEVLGAVPAVLDDAERDGRRRFIWPALGPGEERTVELHVLATAEEVDGPEVRVALGEAEVGGGRPRTVAPRPRPGPVRVVAIPKLGVRAPVVRVPWEPPPFVVGQIEGSAAVTLGNTVLLGHLGGPAGDVFARLDRLRPGDEVIATSRGLDYRFIVSEVAVRPFDDVAPTAQTATPRLTLMTCAGLWSVLRQDYSHRLWVVAEPPELAEQTIRANAERAAEAARQAEAAAAARAAHEAEAAATSAEPRLPAPATAPSAPDPRPTGSPEASSSAASGPAPTPTAAPPATAEAAPSPYPSAPPATADGSAPPAFGDGAAAQATPGDGPMAGAGTGADAPADEPGLPGFTIDAPVDGAAVLRRLVVRGRRAPAAEARAALWLLVRPDVAGGRWYAVPRPLDVRPDGTWEAELELGGEPGIRHQIRLVLADAEADARLRRHAVERPSQPLDTAPDGALPAGLQTGARVGVRLR